MTDLTLRAYVKKIDTLVEHSKLDEAIAHCRYILQTYPKHLETYRLLGKSYLEAKRYGDASDIFQRVLSAVPDDFVSHIGMAIVREDEGNLDSAIWHMERAFETNPANPAIQQELKRLIGRRDNVEPHKVRLTRGALARMYAQGELYPQAIAELRGALQDDPERPDLQVLLARMFWKTDQWAEAADVCNRILEKLPYCREANKIMAIILQANNKLDEASPYHRRLAALDPYAAYVEKATIDPQTVESKSVSILELDWQPGQPLPTSDLGSKNWADSLGIEIDSSSPPLEPKPEEPSWVDGMRAANASDQAPAAASSLKNAEDPEEVASIPQWMQDAGWGEATGEAAEGPVSFSEQELNALDRGELPPQANDDTELDDELAPAEIPSWLQDIAPSEQSAKGAQMSAQSNEGTGNEKLPDWLSDIAAEADDVTPEPYPDSSDDLLPFQSNQAEPQLVEPDEAEENYDEPDTASAVPTWLEESSPGATDTIVGWLGDRPRGIKKEGPLDEQPSGVSQEPPAEAQVEDDDIPTWIGEAQSTDQAGPLPSTPAEPTEAAPDWLSGIAEETGEQPSDAIPPTSQKEAAPDWLSGIAEEPSPTTPESEPPQWLSEPDETAAEQPLQSSTPDWLTPEAGAEDIITPVEDIPGWLAQEAADAGIDTSTPPQGADWIDTPEEDEAGFQESVDEAAPEWLQESDVQFDDSNALTSAEAPAQAPEEDFMGAPEPFDELADPPPPWLKEEQASENTTTQEIYPIPDELKQAARAATGDTTDEMPAGSDDDEVFRWLEGLASRQGADESELTTPEDLRPIETPASITPEETLIADESQTIPEEPEQGLDWLEQLASERGLDVEVEPSSDMSRMPVQPEAEEIEEPQPEAETASEAPEWLQEMQAESAAEAAPQAEAAPVEDTSPPETEAAEELPDIFAEAEMETEAPSWLREMAENPDQMDEETDIFADFAAQLDAEPAEMTQPSSETAENILEPSEPQDELSWLSDDETDSVDSQTDEDISATDWLSRMADDSDETMTAPQVMMEEQASEQVPSSEPEAVQPPTPEEPAPEPVEAKPADIEPTPELVSPTPELAEEIAAEVNDFWAAEDEPEEAAPEPTVPAPATASSPLETAHLGLDHGDLEGAVAIYDDLIQEGRELDGIIAKLNQALAQDPNQALLWQTLGDAYMNNDQLNEAIQAYQKGTEVA